MAQEFLNGTNVLTAFKQMGSKTVAKCVAARGFGNRGTTNRCLDRVLQVPFGDVVSSQAPRARIGRDFGGGKNVLPNPSALGAGIFARESGRKIDAAGAIRQISFVQMPNCFEMEAEG